jgi:hypothetical protein
MTDYDNDDEILKTKHQPLYIGVQDSESKINREIGKQIIIMSYKSYELI